jgi:predicted DCC family thiol-disulfide oxidoreductase YuxK
MQVKFEQFAAASMLGSNDAPPRSNGELLFQRPWEGRAFGIAIALSKKGHYEWEDFRQESLIMKYHVIYDGNCNLCVTFTQLLEQFDRGAIFDYSPMQDETTLQKFGITADDCQMGMILINTEKPEQRWQGSDAAEEIARLLPMGEALITAYRALPGVKWVGDRTYEQIRDNRYQWFGKRDSTYHSAYPIGCHINTH